MKKLSKSTQFDWQLAPYDLRGSIAHCNALLKADVISRLENTIINDALNEMLKDYENDNLHPNEFDEDVHGSLERILIERVGKDIGGKLRAGRSRNDQIATLIRLWMRDKSVIIQSEIVNLLSVITYQASNAIAPIPVIMPGRTHLQHAQPVLLSHHLLAHGQAILRDLERLNDWRKRNNQSPYGAGALAGQTLGLDNDSIAHELGFSACLENSIDAVSSRDCVAEFSFILTMFAINLSRFAEEIIIWNTKEFDFVTLSDSYSTGSSIMPQKKNPDISELARGKSGRIIGDFVGLLSTLKAQPLAYNRDLQEDKEPVFDQVEQLLTLLPAFTGQIQTAKFNYTKMNELAPRGFSLATDIAEWLVKKGVPFRVAHERAGECVALCESRRSESCPEYELWDLNDDDFEQIFGEDVRKFSSTTNLEGVRKVLTAIGSIDSRNNFNGTATNRVKEQLTRFIKKVNDYRL